MSQQIPVTIQVADGDPVTMMATPRTLKSGKVGLFYSGKIPGAHLLPEGVGTRTFQAGLNLTAIHSDGVDPELVRPQD